MLIDLIDETLRRMDDFLEYWGELSGPAGYLEHTTARRDDSIQSLLNIAEPVKDYLKNGNASDFAVIIKQKRELAGGLVGMARRHKERGISAELFFGDLKVLLHAVEKIILESDAPVERKLPAMVQFREIIDAMEVIAIGDWDSDSRDETIEKLQAKSRCLTMEKSKYRNIFEAASDIIFVVDAEGVITEVNKSVVAMFGEGLEGSSVFNYLGVADAGFFSEYSVDGHRELKLPDNRTVVSVSVVPLKKVSLASNGYVIILNDITCMTTRREELEKLVEDRTKALTKSEMIFRSIFNSAGEGIILVDMKLNIVQSNGRADNMFGYGEMSITGLNCAAIFHPESMLIIKQGLLLAEVQTMETQCLKSDGEWFTASITLNRLVLEKEMFLHLIVRNITHQKQMEERILQEKSAAEEMNITLRNVMKTIGRDKEEMENTIAQKVSTQILPAIKKAMAEDNSEIRKMYENIIKEQLLSLTGSEAHNTASLAKLSKAEIQVCRLVQSGYSSKEISESMNISFETVQTHRKNIRKKLGLSGKDLNLFSYLNNS